MRRRNGQASKSKSKESRRDSDPSIAGASDASPASPSSPGFSREQALASAVHVKLPVTDSIIPFSLGEGVEAFPAILRPKGDAMKRARELRKKVLKGQNQGGKAPDTAEESAELGGGNLIGEEEARNRGEVQVEQNQVQREEELNLNQNDNQELDPNADEEPPMAIPSSEDLLRAGYPNLCQLMETTNQLEKLLEMEQGLGLDSANTNNGKTQAGTVSNSDPHHKVTTHKPEELVGLKVETAGLEQTPTNAGVRKHSLTQLDTPGQGHGGSKVSTPIRTGAGGSSTSRPKRELTRVTPLLSPMGGNSAASSAVTSPTAGAGSIRVDASGASLPGSPGSANKKVDLKKFTIGGRLSVRALEQ